MSLIYQPDIRVHEAPKKQASCQKCAVLLATHRDPRQGATQRRHAHRHLTAPSSPPPPIPPSRPTSPSPPPRPPCACMCHRRRHGQRHHSLYVPGVLHSKVKMGARRPDRGKHVSSARALGYVLPPPVQWIQLTLLHFCLDVCVGGRGVRV